MKKHITFSRAFLAAALVLLLWSCAAPKTITGTEDIQTQGFRNQTVNSTQTSIAEIPWRKFFADPALTALIDSALSRNNDLQSAILEIEIAGERFKKARSGMIPEISLALASSNSIPSGNSLNGLTAKQFLGSSSLNNYTAAAVISWEADFWGKVKNQKKEALAQFLQTQQAARSVQSLLIATIAQGYYNLTMLDEQMRIAQKNLALSESTLEIARLRFASGQVSSLAVEQSEAQALVAAKVLPQITQAINEQENALSVLAGVPPRGISRSANLAEAELPISTATGLPSELIARRPDVQQADLALHAADARVGLARAYMYPSLTITAQGGVNALKASDWFNIPGSLFGVVAGGLTQPVLQKRALRTQYNVAQIQREQAVYQFRQSVLTAYREVSDALAAADGLAQQKDVISRRIAHLAAGTAQADLLFRNGKATYLEVIAAQENALSSELELASLRRAQIHNAIDLYRVLGGGWN